VCAIPNSRRMSREADTLVISPMTPHKAANFAAKCDKDNRQGPVYHDCGTVARAPLNWVKCDAGIGTE